MARIVYSIFNTSYRFLLHRTIPRRVPLLVCTFALYWTTLGKLIYSVIRRGPRPSSVISYMLPNNTDQPNKSTGGLGWTLHEKIRKAIVSKKVELVSTLVKLLDLAISSVKTCKQPLIEWCVTVVV